MRGGGNALGVSSSCGWQGGQEGVKSEISLGFLKTAAGLASKFENANASRDASSHLTWAEKVLRLGRERLDTTSSRAESSPELPSCTTKRPGELKQLENICFVLFFLIFPRLFSAWKISQATLLQNQRRAYISHSSELGAPQAAVLMPAPCHSQGVSAVLGSLTSCCWTPRSLPLKDNQQTFAGICCCFFFFFFPSQLWLPEFKCEAPFCQRNINPLSSELLFPINHSPPG